MMRIVRDIGLKVLSTSYLHNRRERMKELKQNDIQSVNGGAKSFEESIDNFFRKLAGIFETEK